jgi:hypothetical protein
LGGPWFGPIALQSEFPIDSRFLCSSRFLLSFGRLWNLPEPGQLVIHNYLVRVSTFYDPDSLDRIKVWSTEMCAFSRCKLAGKS